MKRSPRGRAAAGGEPETGPETMVIHRTEIVRIDRGAAGSPPRFESVEVQVASLGGFDGPVRQAVVALKYRRDPTMARVLGDLMVTLLPEDVDVVSWIPTASSRVRRRGFDQSELIARRVARVAGVRCRSLLRRIDESHQTGRDRAGRLAGPHLVARRACGGRSVVLVDDVVTTGATVRAASAAVLSAGAVRVVCLCACTVGPFRVEPPP